MDLTTVPRWALIGIAVIGLLAIGGIGTWAGAELRGATATNNSQEIEIESLKIRVNVLEESRREIATKLDRILERLGAAP